MTIDTYKKLNDKVSEFVSGDSIQTSAAAVRLRYIAGQLDAASGASQRPSDFITIREFCRLTTLSRVTVYRMIQQGEIAKPAKLTGHRVAFRRADYEAWLAGVD